MTITTHAITIVVIILQLTRVYLYRQKLSLSFGLKLLLSFQTWAVVTAWPSGGCRPTAPVAAHRRMPWRCDSNDGFSQREHPGNGLLLLSKACIYLE